MDEFNVAPKSKSIKIPKTKERHENTWVTHVKNYCKENNIKYRDALRDENCKETYKYVYKKQQD